MYIYWRKIADYAKIRFSKTPYTAVRAFIFESITDMCLKHRHLHNIMFINRKSYDEISFRENKPQNVTFEQVTQMCGKERTFIHKFAKLHIQFCRFLHKNTKRIIKFIFCNNII